VTSGARRRVGALIVGFGLLLLVLAGVAIVRSRHSQPPEVASSLSTALARAVPASAPFPALTEARVAVGGRCLRLVIADSEAERERGLMGRADLGPYDGMLFVSPDDSTDAFTMSGTLVPLDIGWYAHTGAPVDRAQMVPCRGSVSSCPVYRPAAAWRFALETLHGRFPSGGLQGCSS
jgi:uncharacterized membrane protein (UPF0127 family)